MLDPQSPLIEAASRWRIEELASERRTRMTMWALGDYHRFAKATIWEVGPVLVNACGISPGQRVLDVAAGTGNVAIRAAQAGADVVASDVTPENFEAGRREAAQLGVELEWVEADVQDLPFADGSFDAITSSFGAIFAPDHHAAAREMLRVCRPGGVIGMLNFTPDGLAGRFFGTLAPYMPAPPPDALSPLLWGDESHVRALFGEAVDSLEMTRATYVEQATTPTAYYDLFRESFGPLVAVTADLADQPEEAEALDRAFLQFAIESNSAAPGTPAAYEYEYLLVVARKQAR